MKQGRFVLISDVQLASPPNPGNMQWYIDVLAAVVRDECGGVVEGCPKYVDGIIIPGDLVGTGSNLSQWRERWFGPADFFYRYIPQLPAIGNHDVPIEPYLYYFDAPDNGDQGFSEEWYSLDFLNFRLLTMQSNVFSTNSFTARTRSSPVSSPARPRRASTTATPTPTPAGSPATCGTCGSTWPRPVARSTTGVTSRWPTTTRCRTPGTSTATP